ncbi:MAG: hypothetical protein KAW02_06080 [candidate division Zixibacteria bacterium]|nr:hypothetical protein [candidate division Zixibacteria bacterium]
MQTSIFRGKIILLFLALILLGYFLLFGLPEQEQSQFPHKKFILLSFDDFDNLIGRRDRLATDHKKAMFSQYQGRYVRWSGEVYEIVKEISGDFILKVQHTAGIRNFDVTVRFDGSKAEKLERLNRGEAVSYMGRLISFDPDTGYYLKDGELE